MDEEAITQKKRVRSSNFSSEEKILLLNLIDRYKNILESKKTDGETRRHKEKIWLSIAQQFNAQSPSCARREWTTLKTFYENKKKEVRKMAAIEKQEFRKTGGGKGAKLINDPTYELTLSLMNKKTVYGLSNRFDGDGHDIANDAEQQESLTRRTIDNLINLRRESENDENFHNNENLEPAREENRVETQDTIADNIATDNEEETVDWGNYQPAQLQLPKNRKLRQPALHKTDWISRRRPQPSSSGNLSKKYEKLADLKIEMAEIQKTILMSELENHKKKCEWEKQQREMATKRDQEESLLRKEILQLEIKLKRAQLQLLTS